MQIPLPVLLSMVAVGLVLVVVLTYAMGWSATAVLTPERIQQRLAHDLPGEEISAITLADDRRSALVAASGGTVVVFVLGDRLVSRRLPEQPRIDATPTGLRLTLPDPGCPRIDINLAASPTRQALLDTIRGV